MGSGRIVLNRLRFASSRCSAGELTLGELGSVLWESEERPRVNKLGRVAMVKWVKLSRSVLLTRVQNPARGGHSGRMLTMAGLLGRFNVAKPSCLDEGTIS